jgi:hypothetical protein
MYSSFYDRRQSANSGHIFNNSLFEIISMNSRTELVSAAIDRAVEKYSEYDVFRAGVQLIPYIGGPIDTILSGRASRIQLKRLEQFVLDLRSRLELVEIINADVLGDEFADFMLTTLEKVWRARTVEKRRHFANVVSRQVIEAHSWDDADMALRLVSELENIHIDVLEVVLSATNSAGAFEGMKVVALDIELTDDVIGNFSYSLMSRLGTKYSGVALRLACSELTAKGLLHDEGVGRWDTKAMTYFVATDLASWLSKWLMENENASAVGTTIGA